MRLPDTMYFVIADFGHPFGIGAACEPTGERDDAYDAFTASVDAHQDTRVIKVDFDSGIPEAVNDVTLEFAREMRGICKERGLDMPRMAAE